jgi:hypothetical protein
MPTPAGKAVRPRITHQGIDSPARHEALTPLALLRQLKKLRQQNASLRRRLLMQTD